LPLIKQDTNVACKISRKHNSLMLEPKITFIVFVYKAPERCKLNLLDFMLKMNIFAKKIQKIP
jgi:hypothetical protein